MRCGIAVAFASIAVLVAQPHTQTPLARAREAIGGDVRIRAVTSLALTGRAMSGFNGVTAQPLEVVYPVRMALAFPERYLRVDERGGTISRWGFNGPVPIRDAKAVEPGVSVSSSPPGSGFVAQIKVPLARLLLGIFADTKGVLDVKVSPSPHNANMLVATGPAEFAARIDLDPTSGAPVRVRYDDNLFIREPLTVEDRRGGRMSRGQNEDVEVVISFDDRRAVDGLMLPHRILRTVKGVRWEELRFETIVVNPKFTDADFR